MSFSVPSLNTLFYVMLQTIDRHTNKQTKRRKLTSWNAQAVTRGRHVEFWHQLWIDILHYRIVLSIYIYMKSHRGVFKNTRRLLIVIQKVF